MTLIFIYPELYFSIYRWYVGKCSNFFKIRQESEKNADYDEQFSYKEHFYEHVEICDTQYRPIRDR